MKYTRIYETDGTLSAYECEKGRIDIYYYDVTPSGNFHKDYFANGWRFSTLKEAKRELEKE